jgi:hypothetical protein
MRNSRLEVLFDHAEPTTMKDSNLESFIHRSLRSLPDRPAPRSLESRVLAAIEAQASLPWWRKSFAQWPVAARVVFVLLSAGLVKLALMATVWATGGFQASEFVNAFSTQLSWLEAIRGAIRGTIESFSILLRNIPPVWLYGTVAVIAGVYASLFSLGATAYRALYSNRSASS